jgi:hypothetical protein
LEIIFWESIISDDISPKAIRNTNLGIEQNGCRQSIVPSALLNSEFVTGWDETALIVPA